MGNEINLENSFFETFSTILEGNVSLTIQQFLLTMVQLAYRLLLQWMCIQNGKIKISYQ